MVLSSVSVAKPKPLPRAAPTAFQSVATPDNRDGGCVPGSDDRTSSLCAEWKSADASAESARWAALSSWLGGLSIAGVLAALGIALHANRIARQSMEAQVRAWVAIDFLEAVGFRMRGGQPSFVLRASFENVGATPAINFRYFAAMAFGDDPRAHVEETLRHFSTGKIDWVEANLFPQRPLERRISCDHGEETPPITAVHLYVVAHYKTAFSSKDRFTAIMYLIHDGRRADRLIDFSSPPYGEHLLIGAPEQFVGYAT